MASELKEPKRKNNPSGQTEGVMPGKPSVLPATKGSSLTKQGFSLSAHVVWSIHKWVSFIALFFSVIQAYRVRLYSIQIYGWLIHEFDPWFNYRASQYLSDHGWTAFFQWYDYMSWYPLGRPVGTTIYPGIQLTSVLIHEILKYLGIPYTLMEVCIMIPAWFGSISTLLLALLAYEATRSLTAASVAAYLFSILPAHLMRSMAGEYDNECTAMAAMLMTFYTWVRSLRGPRSWPIGLLAGVAYGYMVATWGGYIFVLNMVAVHAGTCVLVDWIRNQYNDNLLKAYTLFFVVGTALATFVPPVGYAPFRSLEQLMPLLLFVFMWSLHFSEKLRRRAEVEVLSVKALQIRSRFFMITLAVLGVVAVVLAPTGYFGPLSSRVRALFVQHTRTGNPLVDSVAEHRPTSESAFWHYLHVCYPLWPIGCIAMTLISSRECERRAKVFIVVFSMISYYFSIRMSRLVLLAGPAAAICSGYILGRLVDISVTQFFWEPVSPTSSRKGVSKTVPSQTTKGKSKKKDNKEDVNNIDKNDFQKSLQKIVSQWPRGFRTGLATAIIALIIFNPVFSSFEKSSQKMAMAFANPRIMYQVRGPNNDIIMIDDYREAYWFLRDNTPEDARILSWWDYGYQITGIGNRTTLADGNTWNHEHIATIGKMLASPVKESHSLIRHLADYVLIWAGDSGEDLLKSPHMARIGNSVYRDICPEDDPLCVNFGFYNQDLNAPTPMMRRSLLYNLHGDGIIPGVRVDKRLFKPVYVSKFGLVKIFQVMNVSKESKAWVADPKNRKCDPSGSWICAGQYPPAKEIQELLAKRIDYGQLEDFNRRKKDDKYYRAYMRRSGME